MSLLDAVTHARELRDRGREDLRTAIVAASAGGHSLREIARAAGLSFTTVRGYLLRHGDEK